MAALQSLLDRWVVMAYGTFATVIVCLAFCVKNWNLQFPCMAVLLQRPLQKSIELFYFLRNEGNPPVWKSGTLSLPWTLGTSSWIFLQPSTLFHISLMYKQPSWPHCYSPDSSTELELLCLDLFSSPSICSPLVTSSASIPMLNFISVPKSSPSSSYNHYNLY